jgi:transposase InsO family protein
MTRWTTTRCALNQAMAASRNRIEHRLTKAYHPWTNGQVERMNRTLKEATVQRYHYASHDELRSHLALRIHLPLMGHRTSSVHGKPAP